MTGTEKHGEMQETGKPATRMGFVIYTEHVGLIHDPRKGGVSVF